MILVWSLMTFTPPSYGTVQFPVWGLALGWCMVVFILLCIPVIAVYKILKVEGSIWKVCATEKNIVEKNIILFFFTFCNVARC